MCEPTEDKDLSTIPYPKTPVPMAQWEAGIKIGACVCVDLVALVGNFLVIAVVARSRRMRSTTNCYIANLAMANLIVALVPIWVFVTSDILGGWPLGGFLCKFNIFIQITAMVASVMTLMAIAGDRFFAIIFPLKARVTERRVGLMVAVIWLCATAIGLPPLFFYKYTQRQWKNYLETFCSDVWPIVKYDNGECDGGLTWKRAYWTSVCVVLSWLPMLVMMIVYSIIIHRLRFSRVQPIAGQNALSAIQRRSKRKVVKMLFVVLVTFMACTLPFQVTTLYSIYRRDMNQTLPAWHKPVYFAAVFLMYTNSAVNPILYGGLNENFRHGVLDLFNCLFCRKGLASHFTMATNISLTHPHANENEARRAVKNDVNPASRPPAVSAAYISAPYTVKKSDDSAMVGR